MHTFFLLRHHNWRKCKKKSSILVKLYSENTKLICISTLLQISCVFISDKTFFKKTFIEEAATQYTMNKCRELLNGLYSNPPFPKCVLEKANLASSHAKYVDIRQLYVNMHYMLWGGRGLKPRVLIHPPSLDYNIIYLYIFILIDYNYDHKKKNSKQIMPL